MTEDEIYIRGKNVGYQAHEQGELMGAKALRYLNNELGRELTEAEVDAFWEGFSNV